MGLDVYLLHYTSLEMRERELEYIKRDDQLWASLTGEGHDLLSKEEQQAREAEYGPGLKAIAQELGLQADVIDEYGQGHSKVRKDSRLHPEHLFKIGYFRSNYFGGFNQITERLIDKDLHWVFEPQDTEDGITPIDWPRATMRARFFLADLETAKLENPNEPHLGWCIQGAEIVLETCEFVSGSSEADLFLLAWSS